jgi:hypothetical protein
LLLLVSCLVSGFQPTLSVHAVVPMEPENPEAAKHDPIGDFHRSASSIRSDLIAGIRSAP